MRKILRFLRKNFRENFRIKGILLSFNLLLACFHTLSALLTFIFLLFDLFNHPLAYYFINNNVIYFLLMKNWNSNADEIQCEDVICMYLWCGIQLLFSSLQSFSNQIQKNESEFRFRAYFLLSYKSSCIFVQRCFYLSNSPNPNKFNSTYIAQ